jgi:hypothetical protein
MVGQRQRESPKPDLINQRETTMLKSELNANETLRPLQDAELDLVNGGIMGGCIRMPTLPPIVQPTDWTFKDVFARYTLGV